MWPILHKLTTCCLEDTLNLGFTKQSCFSVMSYWVVVGVGSGDASTSTGSKRGETWRLCPTVKTGGTVRMKGRWRERLCAWPLWLLVDFGKPFRISELITWSHGFSLSKFVFPIPCYVGVFAVFYFVPTHTFLKFYNPVPLASVLD